MVPCKNCGEMMLEGARFCGKCGTRADEPIKNYCPNCGAPTADGMLFCNQCGARLSAGINPAPEKPKVGRTLTIRRDRQYMCCATGYKVVVSGNDLGNVGVGNSVAAYVTIDTVRVEIRCTTVLMKGIKLVLELRLGENPVVTFKLLYGGAIQATVTGAEVLSESR